MSLVISAFEDNYISVAYDQCSANGRFVHCTDVPRMTALTVRLSKYEMKDVKYLSVGADEGPGFFQVMLQIIYHADAATTTPHSDKVPANVSTNNFKQTSVNNVYLLACGAGMKDRTPSVAVVFNSLRLHELQQHFATSSIKLIVDMKTAAHCFGIGPASPTFPLPTRLFSQFDKYSQTKARTLELMKFDNANYVAAIAAEQEGRQLAIQQHRRRKDIKIESSKFHNQLSVPIDLIRFHRPRLNLNTFYPPSRLHLLLGVGSAAFAWLTQIAPQRVLKFLQLVGVRPDGRHGRSSFVGNDMSRMFQHVYLLNDFNTIPELKVPLPPRQKQHAARRIANRNAAYAAALNRLVNADPTNSTEATTTEDIDSAFCAAYQPRSKPPQRTAAAAAAATIASYRHQQRHAYSSWDNSIMQAPDAAFSPSLHSNISTILERLQPTSPPTSAATATLRKRAQSSSKSHPERDHFNIRRLEDAIRIIAVTDGVNYTDVAIEHHLEHIITVTDTSPDTHAAPADDSPPTKHSRSATTTASASTASSPSSSRHHTPPPAPLKRTKRARLRTGQPSTRAAAVRARDSGFAEPPDEVAPTPPPTCEPQPSPSRAMTTPVRRKQNRQPPEGQQRERSSRQKSLNTKQRNDELQQRRNLMEHQHSLIDSSAH